MKRIRISGKIKPGPRAAFGLLLVLFLAGTAGAVFLLQEYRFDFGITGWSAAGADGTQVSWDETAGAPSPGSLLLSTESEEGLDPHKAVGQCVAAQANRHYSVKASINPDLGDRAGQCFAVPVFYDQPDCQGDGSVTGTGDAVSTGGWQSEVSTLLSFTTTQSVRVELVMSLKPGQGAAACRFDTIGFYEGRLAELVPFLSLSGLAGLAVGLGLVAAMAGRRRRWR